MDRRRGAKARACGLSISRAAADRSRSFMGKVSRKAVGFDCYLTMRKPADRSAKNLEEISGQEPSSLFNSQRRA
jgi:hypothetical protein